MHAPLTFDILDTLERPLARRLRLPCRPSGRTQLRDLPCQFLRGGGAAAGALPGSRPHARVVDIPREERSLRIPADARPQAPTRLTQAWPPPTATAPRHVQPGRPSADGRLSAPARRSDEFIDAAGAARRIGTRCWRRLPRIGPDEIERSFGIATGTCAIPASSTASTTIRRERAALAAQPCAAVDPRRRMGDDRGRPVQRAELLEASLPMSTAPARLVRDGALPAAVVAGNPDFLRPMVGVAPPGGAHLRFYAADLGRGAGRPLVGARRPHPGAFGHGLCAGKPPRPLARDARRSIARMKVAAPRAVLPGLQARALGASAGREGSAHLPADAGAAERDLFRARLSCALSRLPAGRRRRPHGARRRRLRAHDRRAEARRRAGAPARRRLRRPARAQCPLAPRRARLGAGRARRLCRARQFARLGLVESRALLGFLPALAAPCSARICAAECRDLVVRPGARARARSSAGSTTW